jgi:hypothetical protein
MKAVDPSELSSRLDVMSLAAQEEVPPQQHSKQPGVITM